MDGFSRDRVVGQVPPQLSMGIGRGTEATAP